MYEAERLPVKHTEGLILPFADQLRRDERALMLIEEDRFTADTLEDHRWQIIYVERGDRIYEFPRDLGPTSLYVGVGGFLLYSGGEDEVAQLMDMADAERGQNLLKPVLDEVAARSRLVEDAVELLEQKETYIKRNERTLRAQHGL
jgi:hypothetical protein